MSLTTYRLVNILVGLAIGLSILSLGINIGQSQQLNDMRQAYKVCLQAHNEASGQSEQACGDAQDRTNTKFSCLAGNCYLEVK